MKQVERYRHKTKAGGLAEAWPADAPSPDHLAERVRYVGSGEHKDRPVHPTYDLEPCLRSDASRCDPTISREEAEGALRDAVRRQWVSREFVGDFPAYVWGWCRGQPHAARLINATQGWYKAWPIGEDELPSDRRGVLAPPAEEG
ncbi:MAG: hypothetical protein JW751_04820 [Polyangiaceae bacterium]|nr:hypothetical protein [Polyangiaceae bacterium]